MLRTMPYSRLIVSAVLLCLTLSFKANSQELPAAESVKSIAQKVADWQMAHEYDGHLWRAQPAIIPDWARSLAGRKYHDLSWQNAALYAGMYEWSKIADESKYAEWLYQIGQRNNWSLHSRTYHADDHAVGQTFLALARDRNEPALIEGIRTQFDGILAVPQTGSLQWERGVAAQDRWAWSDALFMAPPVWARLASISAEQKYLDFMHQEYMTTYELLWDEENSLWWRDSTFFDRKEENGQAVFWSRGNGWVFAGLALMIPDLPIEWVHREFYLSLYRQMAAKLIQLQRSDGTWSMGLLGEPEAYPIVETSGTAFFTFGLAWGLNQEVLTAEPYQDAVIHAWRALTDAVTEEGIVGFVQPIGGSPGESYPGKTEVYGVGAFLAAAAEVYRLSLL